MSYKRLNDLNALYQKQRLELVALKEIVSPLLTADREDWDRLQAYLAKDMSGYGQHWQQIMKEVRQAIESHGIIGEEKLP